MIIVTGGAGFIGSNLVKALNERGRRDVVVVDDLTDGTKFKNIVDCDILDYVDKDDFLADVKSGAWKSVPDVIFHQGACSTTTEWDGRYMMATNYDYSKTLLHYCMDARVSFIYASSAAVYGANAVFKEDPQHEAPLNVYGYSKLQFDNYVRRIVKRTTSQVVGLRYFNVYGPREQHKGSMASVAFHLNYQIKESGNVRLFEGCDGYGNGEQKRDFIYVGDTVAVNLWFWDHPAKGGIFNLGTGRSQPFNDVAKAVVAYHGQGEINYVPFPDHLRGRYQSFTQADMSALKRIGYEAPFKTVEQGVTEYMAWLNRESA